MKNKNESSICATEPALYTGQDYTRERTTSSSMGNRSEFRRDFARLVHSPAFRRLQGKTQLFPGVESDFFRNRLTHSLEVAQIAKGIALKLNVEHSYFERHNIDTDLVETAALAHDLGHPPFGHNGEYALDECMRDSGGFEGNAQTLRLVTTISKKVAAEENNRHVGLNLTHRTIGAILKYDKLIPIKSLDRKDPARLVKGYYESDAQLVRDAKSSMLGGAEFEGKFKTIECSIMDIADDIAYSTYDLEDALKAGFITPLEILSYAHKQKFLEKISAKVLSGTGMKLSTSEVSEIFVQTFGGFIVEEFEGFDPKDSVDLIGRVIAVYDGSKHVAADGQRRTELTSELVNEFIGGVSVELNHKFPVLSSIKVERSTHLKIEVLKHFTYLAMIMSPRLKIVEYRGRDIIKSIFKSLASEDGYLLLPDDCRDVYEDMTCDIDRKRLICDFIAGMTDRYAIEFYARLTSISKDFSFFKPL
jgi:dGTPase